MSLESFLGLESDKPMSESAFEIFKEKMRAAAAQIAAIKKEENKQKKKETDLLKILLRFVKRSQKQELVLLVSRVLEQNVPASFILAIILLGNEDIQQEVGDYLMLKGRPSKEDEEGQANSEEKALVFFSEKDETMPLKIKIELDNWIKNLLSQAEENPQKLIKTAYQIDMIKLSDEDEDESFYEPKYETKKTIKQVLIQLIAYVVRDFLEQNKIFEAYEKSYEFAEFILKGILTKTEENLEKRHFLKGEISDPV